MEKRLYYSEAILLGSMATAQAFHIIDIKGGLFGDHATCGNGAALFAIGRKMKRSNATGASVIYKEWPWTRRSAVCPYSLLANPLLCEHYSGGYVSKITIPNLVVHLNDDHFWSRSRIASFVRILEQTHGVDDHGAPNKCRPDCALHRACRMVLPAAENEWKRVFAAVPNVPIPDAPMEPSKQTDYVLV